MTSKLYAIVGPNGSGKSSVIRSTELDIVCPFIINPDNFARCTRMWTMRPKDTFLR